MESTNLNNKKNDHTDKKIELNKGSLKKALEFVKNHVRYFAAGALFVALVLILVKCADPSTTGGQAAISTEATEATEEAYQIDAYAEVNNLITQYYTAYAAGDVTALTALASPVSANEQSYITLFSQYVDEYQNIKCYTKSGLDANSYLVSVSMEIKFTGVDTTAPGLDFFYVRTNEDGSLYIDNLYSQYNLANQENALDTSVQSLIYKFENQEDVVTLQQEVQGRYDTAVASDTNLSTMISTTIPGAITDWVTTIVAQTATESTETPETEPATETPATETPATEPVEETPAEPEEETPAETVTSETLTATDRVNVRAAADTESEKLGNVEMGQTVTRTGTEGDWSIIDFNGTKGYIKSEYLTADASAVNNSEETGGGSVSEGTKITLSDTVNIRSGMSETSDRIGTAYSGETVTVVMSYAEGWTKVTWSGKTGYIKTSLLQ